MTFSKRVGMEPAADLKKQLIALCEEAGFFIAHSKVSMFREETLQESVRHVSVYTHAPDWNPTVPKFYVGTAYEQHKDYQIQVRAVIGCDGTFDGTVELRCMAKDQVGAAFVPTLRDCRIAITDLPQALVEVNRQMREVVAGRKRGEKGPWQFGEMLWKEWNGA